jgi:N-acetylglutamate synthase-like GNAT family acetyltransferase
MRHHTRDGAGFDVVSYALRHASAFRDLNLDWIQEYFVVEAKDRALLFSPQEEILDTGGAIWIAERDGMAIACCALLNHGDGVYEVSKMAVAREFRNAGVGRALLHEVVEGARALGATTLTIISNTVLGSAIHLYKSMGFVEVPLESDAYARGNIALELRLS